MHRIRIAAAVGAAVVVLIPSAGLVAQDGPALKPSVELLEAAALKLPGEVDSNSPAIWRQVGNRAFFHVMTSVAGRPSTAVGTQLGRLGPPRQVTIDPWPGGGIWMEAVVTDEDGTWYGYYHEENVAQMCGSRRVIPRIGAVRSSDNGLTWEPLGTVLEAPPGSHDCATFNQYFHGGVGDLSVQLDPESRDLYFFYSLYLRSERQQGVGVARLAWADRDNPVGKIMIWRIRAWVPASVTLRPDESQRVIYPAAMPIFPTTEAWHDSDWRVDAFWGPSVHWNTHLQLYVMLLNRAEDETFRQEGIYVSFAPRVDDPTLWSTPVKILDGGKWYPQVIGMDAGGTDKVSGEWARFFMLGTSNHLIRFVR
jgi:hypothetical protein